MVKQHLSSPKDVQKGEAGRREIAVRTCKNGKQEGGKLQSSHGLNVSGHDCPSCYTFEKQLSCGVNPWETGAYKAQ